MIEMFFKNQKIRNNVALFLSKFWMTLASIGIAINLIMVLTLLQMAPKLKIVAQVLPSSETTINSTSHIQVDTLPIQGLLNSTSNINKQNRALIDEMLVRYYIDIRLSVFADEWEMRERWAPGGVINRLSSPRVYGSFYTKKIRETIKAIKNAKITQSVDVVSISALGNTYTIEVDVYTHNPFEPLERPKVQRRVINMEIGHRPNIHHYNKIESNPYGFYVTQYHEKIKRQ